MHLEMNPRLAKNAKRQESNTFIPLKPLPCYTLAGKMLSQRLPQTERKEARPT